MTPLQSVDFLLAQSNARQTFTPTEVENVLNLLPENVETLAARLGLQGQTTLNRTQVRDLMLDVRRSAGSTALTQGEAA